MTFRNGPDSDRDTQLDVVVIGAGFSGLYALQRLRSEGFRVRVLEQGDGVGGTWYWNRYPGARCDSESYYYSYSFDEELQHEWEWTERYPEHFEIRAYLEHVAERFDLHRDIDLGTRVESATFDDATSTWAVRTADRTLTCRFLVTAVGCLSTANVPDIPGLDTFAGEWFHTGRWPHEGVDLARKRVGIVGTGSTGIQAVPVVAKEAAHLTVFQRTANYSIPARNGPVSAAERAEVKARYDEIRRIQRASTNGHPFLISEVSALAVDEAERTAIYEKAWERGSLKFRASFADLLTSREANDTASDFIRDKIRAVVRDPATAEKLTPRDHGFATKRPPIDTDYFEAYNRPNVSLVDVRADPIREITPAGIRTGEEHPLDVIIFATGFDAMTGPLLGFDIRGAGGVPLRDKWAAGPVTHLGLQVAGFPNLFTITGPGSPSVLCNMPTAIEQHVEWIADCLVHLREKGVSRMETTEEAERAWVAHVNEVAHRTLLPQASTSWYLGANVPGKPRVFMPYAGGMATYAKTCAEVAEKGYEGFVLSA
ncbi:flavin-containing monooxygenase [Pseudonocardia halophobica]|uniref:flavin-containing monooxygenase n=1 Tax=Pseudonocardia halophobica TaxID=29401 RepID=UPI003D8F6D4B